MAGQTKIGALISGTGTNLRAIIAACNAGKLPAEVVFIGSDTPQAAGLELGHRHGIPTAVIDYRAILRASRDGLSGTAPPPDADMDALLKKQTLFPASVDPHKVTAFFSSRVMAESRLLDAMAPHKIDLLVLAGYMRILTPYFIDRVNTDPQHPRIMNIHPALLPAFPGTDGYRDAFRFGCKVAGCTVHFVDYGQDTGAIIGQTAFAIERNDTLDTVREKGLKLEWVLYPECINLFAQGRLKTVLMTYARPGSRQPSERRVVKILPPSTAAGKDQHP